MIKLTIDNKEDAKPISGTRLLAVNVGKADCLLAVCGSSAYMIDTGSKDSWQAVKNALKRMNITHLDGVIVTHTDKDHSGGAAQLAKCGIPAEHWYASAFFANIKKKKHPVVRAASTAQHNVEWLSGGAELPFGNGTMKVLGPLKPSEKENNNSLVLRIETQDGTILLTGDMQFDEETDLLEAGLLNRVDVLKIAHHASGDASSPEFLQAVRPRVALISTSSIEAPDTPSNRVIKLLKSVGASPFFTQHTSTGVMITMNAGNIMVETLKN